MNSPQPNPDGWLSWHIHVPFAAADRIDELVAGPLAGLIAALRQDRAISRWFFIRYWEGGPHLRLRLRPTTRSSPAGLDTAVREAFAALAGALNESDAVAGYLDGISRLARASGLADPSVDESLATTVQPPGVHAATYVPERARYGSGELLDAAEAVFERSSDLAVRVAGAAPTTMQLRLIGLEVIAKLADGVERLGGDTDAYLARYADYWRWWAESVAPPVFDTAVLGDGATCLATALADQGGVSAGRLVARDSAVTAWHDAALDSLRPHPGTGPGALTREGVAISQTHMTLNRLGLLVHEEFMLIATLRGLR
ncbi:thiopeptide-type bacteriocin biosynthesis protein [Kitasatospora sp. NPDC101155]|uniref:thiopeptide-type bacteriocin biosynthesis protein n=1 Tax=Kitasatospora sp. NPDC101155 TaxID=3364097 RepID=UPI0038041910